MVLLTGAFGGDSEPDDPWTSGPSLARTSTLRARCVSTGDRPSLGMTVPPMRYTARSADVVSVTTLGVELPSAEFRRERDRLWMNVLTLDPMLNGGVCSSLSPLGETRPRDRVRGR